MLAAIRRALSFTAYQTSVKAKLPATRKSPTVETASVLPVDQLLPGSRSFD
jgi:hypothetical protein